MHFSLFCTLPECQKQLWKLPSNLHDIPGTARARINAPKSSITKQMLGASEISHSKTALKELNNQMKMTSCRCLRPVYKEIKKQLELRIRIGRPGVLRQQRWSICGFNYVSVASQCPEVSGGGSQKSNNNPRG